MGDEQNNNTHDERAEALRALADGRHEEPDEAETEAVDQADPHAGAVPDAPGDAADVMGMDGAEAPALAQTAEARKQRAAAATRRSQHHAGRQFRAVMIPLMLATSGLLIILATIVLIKGSGRGTVGGSILGRGWTPYVVLGAYPVAALLALGAWLFWRELRQGPR